MTSLSRALTSSTPRFGLSKRVPEYWRVYEEVRRRIEGFDYVVGSFVPPESELCALLGVSRTTVRKAVEMLVDEGFLAVRRGRGTEVLDFRAVQTLQRISSFSETLRQRGCLVAYRELTVRRVPAPSSVAEGLRLEPGAPVVLVHRLVVADGKPIAIVENHLVPEVVPGLEKKAQRMRVQSLYAFLESEYGITLDGAKDVITALAATAEEARRLRVGPGTPLLIMRRLSSADGQPVECAVLRIVASRYELSVETSKRPRGHT
ncbi:MAG TPA: GntR family transcriptional regulator [Anaeromyxobacter sp.]|nr:GntR family transcriptional regulator [Anaeromyxobacter sp.]